ncbi:four helix bundle protein [Candidatus Gottesmanbacteria bacterium]|nr:four helix bundle protein [Candidatus Gottesmanbacteria bacterium]
MNTKQGKQYDLEDRTMQFAEGVIEYCKSIRHDTVITPLVSQLVRSASSIGANYQEANGAASKRDFRNKIFVCKKEAMETKYWLRLLAKATGQEVDVCRKLWKEAHELTLIFSKIASSSR